MTTCNFKYLTGLKLLTYLNVVYLVVRAIYRPLYSHTVHFMACHWAMRLQLLVSCRRQFVFFFFRWWKTFFRRPILKVRILFILFPLATFFQLLACWERARTRRLPSGTASAAYPRGPRFRWTEIFILKNLKKKSSEKEAKQLSAGHRVQ